MATTTKPIRAVPTDRSKRWRVEGVRCRCGGELFIDRVASHDPDFRYETFCKGCLSCDCNGWRTIAECVENAASYFSPEGAALRAGKP